MACARIFRRPNRSPRLSGWARVALLSLSLLACQTPRAHGVDTSAEHAIVVDHRTGTILFEKAARVPIYPASMTKMMTTYMVFDALAREALSMQDRFAVSEKAWRKGGSKMFVREGTQVSVRDLLYGIIVQSGNDASIVVAEGMAGSEAAFARRMNEKARALGMRDSRFRNATGWPDAKHVTTARDLAILVRRLIQDFPQYYPIFAEHHFTYNGIKQRNRNSLLWQDLGVDGLKTGHTEAAGYGIAISGVNRGRRVHVVVGGLDSEAARAHQAARLYRYAQAAFHHYLPPQNAQPIAQLPVWYGARDRVAVGLQPEEPLVVPDILGNDMQMHLTYERSMQAPIAAGDVVGTLRVTGAGMSEQRIDVVAQHAVPAAGLWSRLKTNLEALLGQGPAPHATTSPAPAT